MKISMLGHKQIPGRSGGVEVVTEELSKRLIKLGHDVTCYNRSTKNQKKEFYHEGIRVIPVKTIYKKGLAAITSSFFATKKAIKGDSDVIHFHAEGPSIWTKMAKKHSNKRIIVTIHGLDWQRAKWGGLATKVIKKGEENAVKYADEIIVLSKNVQDYFKEKYDRKTIFIPNGVDKGILLKPDIIKKEFGLDKDEYILYLSRIVPEKRLDLLIKAYKNLNTDKKLVIAGTPGDTDEFYREVKELAKDDKNIIFTGFVSGNLLKELYSNALCYVLPSDLEGMALTLLEALSYGNKCVVSSIKENTEVVEDMALVFEQGNQNDLEKKLKLIIDNKDKLGTRKDIIKFITTKYNWDKVVEETLKLYTRGAKNEKDNNTKNK